MCFRSVNAAAPLKPERRADLSTAERSFRSVNAAAPLKRALLEKDHPIFLRFRSVNAAAPLKPAGLGAPYRRALVSAALTLRPH